MRGGYLVIDLKSKALTSGTAATIPGSFAAASNPYKKATLISGLIVGGTAYPEFYAPFAVSGANMSAQASVNGAALTIVITPADAVTVTVA